MARLVKFEKEFESREDAQAWWDDYQWRAWGYDPRGRIVQKPDGKWIFDGEQYDSCD